MIATLITVNNESNLFIDDAAIDGVKTLGYDERFTADLVKAYEDCRDCSISSGKMLIGGSKNFKMQKLNLDEERVFTLCSQYWTELQKQVLARPDAFSGDMRSMYSRFMYAVLTENYNKDSECLKLACKALKIKFTYKAIQAYLRGE